MWYNYYNNNNIIIIIIIIIIGTSSVSGRYWGIAIGLSICIFIIGEMRKWIIYLYPKSYLSRFILFKW